jgi:Protein of unknown function (DUF3106)
MRSHTPFRILLGAAVVLLAGVGTAFARGREPGQPQQELSRPQERRAERLAQNGGMRQVQNGGARMAQNGARRPGLEQWMENHKNLSPAEQRRALQGDPSFRALPPQQQQGALNELNRLQNMSPERLNRRQALLRMTPQQRQQFNFSVQQYAALPPGRRALVGRAFGELRRVPLGDRAAAMSTYPLLRQFSPYERQVLSNLLVWEPYFADQGPGEGR